MTKKILAILMALVLTLAMTTVAFADEPVATPKPDQNASFTKTYKITNAGMTNPGETFTFKFAADHVTDSNMNLGTTNMPTIPDATVTFDAGTATTDGLVKTVDVALSGVTWPGVGVYYYRVNEVAGKTAGVTYDKATAYLKVTVAYDQGTDTYYTAFVTLNLADEDNNGITDSKTGGFINVYSAGDLTVTKKVTGNMGDTSAYFDVTVTLTGVTGEVYAESYAVTGGSNTGNPTTIAIGTPTTFKLKHDETITIANLPYGVTYTVVEADYTTDANGKYDAAEYKFDDANKKIDSASDAVTITNNKGVTVDTGITMDSIPYIVLLAVVAIGVVAMLLKKRHEA